MEKLPSQLTLAEFDALYAGRMPKRDPLPPRHPWEVPPGLRDELAGILLQRVPPKRVTPLEEVKLQTEEVTLPCATDRSLAWNLWSARDGNAWSVRFLLVPRTLAEKEGVREMEPILDFNCENYVENIHSIAHRYVAPEHRGKCILDSVVDPALCQAVQRTANVLRKSQKIALSVGQPEVLLAFLRAGYTMTKRHRSKLERILAGNRDLFLEHEYEELRNEQGLPMGWMPNERMYIYSKRSVGAKFDRSRLNKNTAYRVSLEKNFRPMKTDVDDTISKTSREARKTIAEQEKPE
ncbi:MAG: hypothetical protein Q7R81_02990 [Candidatus Peregrinibacteria bacterium]|nr:hypothetical protein [Candidatus Peregrinibacteria bacterium]